MVLSQNCDLYVLPFVQLCYLCIPFEEKTLQLKKKRKKKNVSLQSLVCHGLLSEMANWIQLD